MHFLAMVHLIDPRAGDGQPQLAVHSRPMTTPYIEVRTVEGAWMRALLLPAAAPVEHVRPS
ncbi:hypothetical protein ADK38_39390, partial [Streptomyces varsoviensis]